MYEKEKQAGSQASLSIIFKSFFLLIEENGTLVNSKGGHFKLGKSQPKEFYFWLTLAALSGALRFTVIYIF